MTMRRQAFYVVVVAAVAGSTCDALTGGSLREAISYGIAVATGMFIGLGLAKR